MVIRLMGETLARERDVVAPVRLRGVASADGSAPTIPTPQSAGPGGGR